MELYAWQLFKIYTKSNEAVLARCEIVDLFFWLSLSLLFL